MSTLKNKFKVKPPRPTAVAKCDICKKDYTYYTYKPKIKYCARCLYENQTALKISEVENE